MSAKANPKVVGGFVIGAIILMITAIVVFSTGGALFAQKERYVIFFPESVGGLTVGSPVTFRGVRLGEVVDIRVVADVDTLDVLIPVTVEILRDRVQRTAKDKKDWEDVNAIDLVNVGLRAQLETQSLVTGQRIVQLRFSPETPVNLVDVETEHEQIPAIPSKFKELTLTVDDTLKKIQELAGSGELREAIASFRRAMDNVGGLAKSVDDEVAPVSTSVQGAADDVGQLARGIDAQVDPLSNEVSVTLGQARKTMRIIDSEVEPSGRAFRSTMSQGRSTLRTYEQIAEPGSTLSRTLNDLSAAARSIRDFAEILKRNPEALIQGRGGRRR
ncbi:MAG: MlaD family protein [Alphaproteobacteria bacterium]|nr:MlaD family protein [Alphaproteobacteria bacterium]